VAKNFPNPPGRAAATLIQRVIDDPQPGNFINQMRWMVLVNSRPKNLLLTSDRPVVMTNGIAHENAQILIPISPHHAFVATNNVQTENYVRDVWHRRQMSRRRQRVGLIAGRSADQRCRVGAPRARVNG
jgi:hypothetical protein